MADIGTKIGRMPCPEHAAEKLLVRENPATGTLSARCDECDTTHYAKKGTGQHRSWQAKIVRTEPAPAPKAEPKPAPTPEPKPAPKKNFLDLL